MKKISFNIFGDNAGSAFIYGMVTGTIIWILGIIFFLLFSCKAADPTILLKEHCDEKAIKKHIDSCVPAGVKGQELEHYKHECTKEAKQKYCKDKRFLVIRGKEIPCDNVSKKYKNHCD